MRGIAYKIDKTGCSKKGKINPSKHISLFQLIYSHGIVGKLMKAQDETEDNIMTVMLTNDQNLQ